MATTKIKTQRKPRQSSNPAHRKPIKDGDEVWDKLLETPESEAFLTLMAANVKKQRAEGKTIQNGWDEL